MLHKLSERKIKVPVGLVFLLRKKKDSETKPENYHFLCE